MAILKEGQNNLDRRIDTIEANLKKRIDGTQTNLNKRINSVKARLNIILSVIFTGLLEIIVKPVFIKEIFPQT